MIRVKLREAMKAYRRKHGSKFTYKTLAETSTRVSENCAISEDTLGAIESRESYNTTLKSINTICRLLDTTPAQLLEYIPDDEISPAKASRTAPQDAHKKSKPKRAKAVSKTGKQSRRTVSATKSKKRGAKPKTE